MFEFHKYLGEGLFIIYLVLLAVTWFMARNQRPVPPLLTAIGHGLLALQVALGVILLAEGHRVAWYHPMLGIAALLCLGLVPVFKTRFGATRGMMMVLALIALLTAMAFFSVASFL